MTEAGDQPHAGLPRSGFLRFIASLFDHRRYRRLTDSHELIREIDGLRFVAIAAVFLCHLPSTLLKHASLHYTLGSLEQNIVKVSDFGGAGVLLFFVISGFIVGLPFARYRLGKGRAVSLRRYFLRRLTRIEPPYILNLLFCATLLVFSHKYDLGTIAARLAASLGYAHELIFRDQSWINRVTWSLEVEVQFYLLAPLLAGVFSLPTKLRRSVLVGAIVLSSLLAPLLPVTPEWLMKHLHFFLAGYLLVDLYLTGELGTRVRHTGWPAFLLIVAAYLVHSTSPWLATLILPWTMFAVVVAGLCSSPFRAWLSLPWIWTTGGMCYTIYLYHGVIISSIVQSIFLRPHYTGDLLGDTLLLAAIALPLTAIVSLAMFRWVERPCMRVGWCNDLQLRLRRAPILDSPEKGLPAKGST